MKVAINGGESKAGTACRPRKSWLTEGCVPECDADEQQFQDVANSLATAQDAALNVLRWAHDLSWRLSSAPDAVRAAAFESIKVAVGALLGDVVVPADCLIDLHTLLSKGSVAPNDEADMRRTVEFIERRLAGHTVGFIVDGKRRPMALSTIARMEGPELLRDLQSMPYRFGSEKSPKLTEQDCRQALALWVPRSAKGRLTTVGVAVALSLKCGAFGVLVRSDHLDYGTERQALLNDFTRATKARGATNRAKKKR